MTPRRAFGFLLIALSIASVVQSVREVVLWEGGQSRYDERFITQRRFRFAGQSFEVVDEHPYAPRSGEAEVPGTIRLLANGSMIGAPSRAEVRPGHDDLGRYHLWFDARIFRDRRSGDSTLWMARRIGADGSSPRFEVTTIRADGARTRRLFRTHQLGRSYPLFRTTQFLRGSSFWVVPLSVLDFGIFPPFLLVFPIGTLVFGIILLRRRRVRTIEPAKSGEMMLVVWRDSVAMGDDIDAPHELRLPTAPDATVEEVTKRLLGAGYLASVMGGATWIVEGERPVAVLAQRGSKARFLIPPDTPVWTLVKPGGEPHLDVRYWCQVDARRVFDALQNGDPLPDRYGR